MKGQTLSHYRVLELCGQGASGVIYKAEDLSLGRVVALKCLPANAPGSDSSVLRFQHEARTASGINHPHICTIHEIGEHDGRQFIVMEWLEGRTLAELIGNRPLRLETLLDYAIQAADGLHAAHTEGIVHRDVKPANVFVTNKGQVKILDFGIATLMSRSTQWAQAGSTPVGTAPYMSPEQIQNDDLDHRSDLFSLGVVLYEMATGRRPFVAGTIPEIARLIVEHTPDPPRALNPEIPHELDRIITKALEKNRKLRFQSAADLMVDLERLKREFESGMLRSAPTANNTHSAARAARRMPHLAALGIAGSLIVLSVILIKLRPFTEDAPAERSVDRSDLSPARSADIVLETPSASTTASQPPQTARAQPPQHTQSLRPTAGSPALSPAVSNKPEPSGNAAGGLNRELDIVRKKAEVGLYEQALQTLRPLLSQYSSDPEIAVAYLLMGDIQEAHNSYGDAMATYVETADRFGQEHGAQALYRFANVALKSNQRDKELKARDALGQVASRYPESEWAPLGLLLKAEIEERKRMYELDAALGTSVPSALVTYRRVVEAYPTVGGSMTAHKKLAELYQGVRRYDLAAQVLVDLATRYPDPSGEAWYRAGELYRRRLRDPKLARDAYTRVPKGSRYFNDAQERLQ